MTEYVLSIDPGVSTGIALLSFEEDSPAELVQGWQFTGGVSGLLRWYGNGTYPFDFGVGLKVKFPEPIYLSKTRIVTEKFTARATKGFSYTTSSLEPLRGEGALIALGLMPDYTVAEKRWRDPGVQYLVGGKDRADKKKRQHKFLKESGFYRTGKDFGTSDADDFRSASAHGINYIARELKHKPTFDTISEWTEKN